MITVFFSILVLFLSVEILLRVFAQFTPTFYAPKAKRYNQFRANPNSWVNGFQLNSKGFHDEEFSFKKKEGSIRILALGDSFVFGVVPYQFNFITLLEKLLKAKNPSIEIINMGIPSTTINDYLALLVDEGLELNPDMILLNIYIGNDIRDTEKKVVSSSYLIRFFTYLNAMSKFEETKNITEGRMGGAGKENNYEDYKKTFDDEAFNEILIELFLTYFEQKDAINRFNPKYKSVFKDLKIIKQICRAKNIKLLVNLLPSEIQVDTDLQKKFQLDLKNSNYAVALPYEEVIKSINYIRPNILMKKALEDEKILYLDLLEAFQQKGKTEKLYKPNDTHWNIAGNSLAAQLIFEYFVKEKIFLDQLLPK